MTHRIASLALTLVAFATTAHAATLSVFADKRIYLESAENVTLTVVGDDEGALAYSMVGRLSYDSILLSPIRASQTPAGPGWIQGTLPQTDGSVYAFDQIAFPAATASNFPGTISVVTLFASTAGIVNVSWGSNLSFFGLTAADVQGTAFCIERAEQDVLGPACSSFVPEPTTGALLALGLFSIALASRMRT